MPSPKRKKSCSSDDDAIHQHHHHSSTHRHTHLDDELFMRAALDEAQYAMDHEEVPVGCVIVDKHSGKIVARAGNRTTAERNATRHCELVAFDQVISASLLFTNMRLYVTVEPCIMCASALRIVGLTDIVFGCANDRFGGCGSIYDAHSICASFLPPLSLKSGLLGAEAVALLKSFYERGNPKAPDAKRHRPLIERQIDA